MGKGIIYILIFKAMPVRREGNIGIFFSPPYASAHNTWLIAKTTKWHGAECTYNHALWSTPIE